MAPERQIVALWSRSYEERGWHTTGNCSAWLRDDLGGTCSEDSTGQSLELCTRLADQAAAEDVLATVPGISSSRLAAQMQQHSALAEALCAHLPGAATFDSLLARKLRFVQHRLLPALAAEWKSTRSAAAAPPAPEVADSEGNTASAAASSSLYEALFTQLAAEGALDTPQATDAILRALAVHIAVGSQLKTVDDKALQPLRSWLLTTSRTRPLARAAATAMAAARGSLVDLLVIAAMSGEHGGPSTADPSMMTSVAVNRAVTALRAANAADRGSRAPVLDDTHVLGSLSLPCAVAGGPTGVLATACDGTAHLLILHVDGTLSRVSTGMDGAQPGKVQVSCTILDADDNTGDQQSSRALPRLRTDRVDSHVAHHSCIAVHGDVAYVRTPGIAPAVFLAYHVPSMSFIGRIMPDGQPRQPGDFHTDMSNASLPYFAPPPSVSQCRMSASRYSPRDDRLCPDVPYAREQHTLLQPDGNGCPPVVVSDGCLVHFIVQEAAGQPGEESQPLPPVVRVHSHDPASRWARVATVTLRGDGDVCVPPPSGKGHDQGSWFAGNGLVGCLMPPDMSSASARHGALFTVRVFRISDGSHVQDTDAGVVPLERCLLYPRPEARAGAYAGAMMSEAWRMLSFRNWPHMSYAHAHPVTLASSGFTFLPEQGARPLGGRRRIFPPNDEDSEDAGDNDRCVCFSCGVALVSWLPADVPLWEHERHTSQCAMIEGADDRTSGNVRMRTPKLALAYDTVNGILWAVPVSGSTSMTAEHDETTLPVAATAWRAPAAGADQENSASAVSSSDPFDALLPALEAHVMTCVQPHAVEQLATLLKPTDMDSTASFEGNNSAATKPFDMTPSIDAFTTLASLLMNETAHIKSGRRRLLVLSVRVTGIHLSRAVALGTSNNHIIALGLACPAPQSPVGVPQRVISTQVAVNLRDALLACCTSSFDDVADAASEALVAGLPLLWPSGYEQALLLTAICGCDTSMSVPLSVSRAMVKILARSLPLLQFLADPQSHVMASTLRGVLLNQLTGSTIRQLCDSVPGAANTPQATLPGVVTNLEEAQLVAVLLCTSGRWATCVEAPEQQGKRLVAMLQAASELASAGASSISAGASPSLVCNVLRTSALCTLLPEVLTIATATPQSCVAALPHLRTCLAALARLADALPLEALQSEDVPCALAAPVVVESSHPCDVKASWERILRFPGATHVRVTFDSRCSVERGAGNVRLFAGAGAGMQPASRAFSGGVRSLFSGTGWPTGPVMVPGDTVTVVFRVDECAGREWGFRAFAEGMFTVPMPATSWLSGVRRLLATCFGTACAHLCMLDIPPTASDNQAATRLHTLLAAMEASCQDTAPLTTALPLDPEALLAATTQCNDTVWVSPATNEPVSFDSSQRLRTLCGAPQLPVLLVGRPTSEVYVSVLDAMLHATGLQGLKTAEPLDEKLRACFAVVFGAADALLVHVAMRRQQLYVDDATGVEADAYVRDVLRAAHVIRRLPAPPAVPDEVAHVTAVASAAAAVMRQCTSAECEETECEETLSAAARNVAGTTAAFAWAATATDILASGTPDGARSMCCALAHVLHMQQRSGMASLHGAALPLACSMLSSARASLLAAVLRLLPSGLDRASQEGLGEEHGAPFAEATLGALQMLLSLRPFRVNDASLLREANAITALCGLAQLGLLKSLASPRISVSRFTAEEAVRSSALALLHVVASTTGIAEEEVMLPVANLLSLLAQQYKRNAVVTSAGDKPRNDADACAAFERVMCRLAAFLLPRLPFHCPSAIDLCDQLLSASLVAPPNTALYLLRLWAALHTSAAGLVDLDGQLRQAARLCGGALLAVCTGDHRYYSPCVDFPNVILTPRIPDRFGKNGVHWRQRHLPITVVSSIANELALALRIVLASGSDAAHPLLDALIAASHRVAARTTRIPTAEQEADEKELEDALLAFALVAIVGGGDALAGNAPKVGWAANVFGAHPPMPLPPPPLVGFFTAEGNAHVVGIVAGRSDGVGPFSVLLDGTVTRVNAARIVRAWPLELPSSIAAACSAVVAKLYLGMITLEDSLTSIVCEEKPLGCMPIVALRALVSLLTGPAASNVCTELFDTHAHMLRSIWQRGVKKERKYSLGAVHDSAVALAYHMQLLSSVQRWHFARGDHAVVVSNTESDDGGAEQPLDDRAPSPPAPDHVRPSEVVDNYDDEVGAEVEPLLEGVELASDPLESLHDHFVAFTSSALGGAASGSLLDPGMSLMAGEHAALRFRSDPDVPPNSSSCFSEAIADPDKRRVDLWVPGTGHAVLRAECDRGRTTLVFVPDGDAGTATYLWVPTSNLYLLDDFTAETTRGLDMVCDLLTEQVGALETRLCRQAVAHAIAAAMATGLPARRVLEAMSSDRAASHQTAGELLEFISALTPPLETSDPPCPVTASLLHLLKTLCCNDDLTWAPYFSQLLKATFEKCAASREEVHLIRVAPGEPYFGKFEFEAVAMSVRVHVQAMQRVQGSYLLASQEPPHTPVVQVRWDSRHAQRVSRGQDSRVEALSLRQAQTLQGIVLAGQGGGRQVVSLSVCNLGAQMPPARWPLVLAPVGGDIPGESEHPEPGVVHGMHLGAGLWLADTLLHDSRAMTPAHASIVGNALARYVLSPSANPTGKHTALRLVTHLLRCCSATLDDRTTIKFKSAFLSALRIERFLKADLAPEPFSSAFLSAFLDACLALGTRPKLLFEPPLLLPCNAATCILGNRLVCYDDCSTAVARWDGSTMETFEHRYFYEARITGRGASTACIGWMALSDGVAGRACVTEDLGATADGPQAYSFCPGKHRFYNCGGHVPYGYASSAPDSDDDDDDDDDDRESARDPITIGVSAVMDDAGSGMTLNFWRNGRECGQLRVDTAPARMVPAASVSGGGAEVTFVSTPHCTVLNCDPIGTHTSGLLDAGAELFAVAKNLACGEPAPLTFVERAVEAHLWPPPGINCQPTLHDLRAACALALEKAAASGTDAVLWPSGDLPQLSGGDSGELRVAFACVVHLSAMVCYLLPFLDFSQPAHETGGTLVSLVDCVAAVREAVLPWAIEGWIKRMMDSTACADARPSLCLNRARAAAVAAGPGAASRGAAPGSLFAQAAAALRGLSPRRLRQTARAWTVYLDGEGAQDMGGPYYESISAICAELQSCPDAEIGDTHQPLPVLIPTPNQRAGVGSHQECWLPHPQADAALLQLLGILLGVAVRTRVPLDLDLPPLVYRALARAPLRDCDWAEVDVLQAKALQALEQETSMESIWEMPLLDGTVKQISGGGSAAQIAAAARRARDAQLASAIHALRSGLLSIVPQPMLRVLSAQQLAIACCGQPDVDVDKLRERATYAGLSESTPHVLLFWTVLSELTHQQRRAFLRFVSGRSRMPASAVPGTINGRGLEIQPLSHLRAGQSGTTQDGYLPVAHTCFFALELPAYSSAAIMKEKLLYALTEGVAIDADHVVRDAAAWADASPDRIASFT